MHTAGGGRCSLSPVLPLNPIFLEFLGTLFLLPNNFLLLLMDLLLASCFIYLFLVNLASKHTTPKLHIDQNYLIDILTDEFRRFELNLVGF